MNCIELSNSDFRRDLVGEINNTDLSKYSNSDLHNLKEVLICVEKLAAQRTLEDELVGYAYSNLNLLTPKINQEMSKRKIKM